MRRRLCALVALALLLGMSALGETDRHQVIYFYRNYCESCDPEGDFADQFRALTGLSLADCDFTGWNAVRSDGQAALERAEADYGLQNPSLPMVIVDGEVYQGASQMNGRLAEAALSWPDTLDSEVLFLYVPACESCAGAEAALEALPDAVTVKRGDVELVSPVVVTRLDISGDPDTAQALFEAYGVPDEQRVTPIAFYADRYLSGGSAIADRLASEIALGRAVGGVARVKGKAAFRRPATLLQAVGAGLMAGLNTCALSMLLLFVSLLLRSGRRAVGPVIGYLLAKLACYLAIGFALLGLFQRLNLSWLRPLARWLLTLIGAALIALNLWDAWHARRGDFGAIRNQLPTGLRGALRRVIQGLTQSKALVPASVLLGFIVAGGEFLCAGQLYLMQLMNAAQSGLSGQGRVLAAYCLAFLTPSAAVSAAVVAGGSQLRAADFFARHTALIKVLTALAMLALIITAWIL